MDYREIQAPSELRHLVKAGWTLDVPCEGPDWVEHVATPDGCMELIRRLDGRSLWNGDQPEAFVAGVITRPTRLQFAAGSRFVGVRIWPWTWVALTKRSPVTLTDRWMALSEDALGMELPTTIDGFFDLVGSDVSGSKLAFVEKVLVARSCADLSASTGHSPRTLQRWFERNVGQPPRLWLRLLRFSDAFATLPGAESSLAEHALDHGYADQAHMAREFRSLAGAPAGTARKHGKGPFLSPD